MVLSRSLPRLTTTTTAANSTSTSSSHHHHHHKVIELAKRVVLSSSSSTCGGDEQGKTIQELTKHLQNTNPTLLFTPRVPKTLNFPTPAQKLLFESIQNQAAAQEDSILNGNNSEEEGEGPESLLLTETNKTYGETPVETILTLLNILYPKTTTNSSSSHSSSSRGIFIDGGSGIGLPALTAATCFSHQFQIAKGIEYQRKWHKHAKAIQTAYYKSNQQPSPPFCQLEYICGDMTSIPGLFSPVSANGNANGCCIYLNSVVWDANLCNAVSQRIEQDVVSRQEDVYVVSMSRRLPLPSFDLIDVVRLPANGGGIFTFYLNKLDTTSKTTTKENSIHNATSDSESMRLLRSSYEGLWDEVVQTALRYPSHMVGIPLLIAIASSEPSTRRIVGAQQQQNDNSVLSWIMESMTTSTTTTTTDVSSSLLQTKALSSMLLRAIVDHPIGRRSINTYSNGGDDLVGVILQRIADDTEHVAIRTNLLDVVSNLLQDDSLMSSHQDLLDKAIDSVMRENNNGNNNNNANLTEAIQEVMAMRRWWDGYARDPEMLLPNNS